MNTEQAILSFVESLTKTNFSIIMTLIQLLFIAFWIVVLGWVWVDASERSTHKYARVMSVILVGTLNIVGLLIYLLIRPKNTIQELYWADLERRYLKYETSELGDCANCRHSLQPGFNNCPRCGYQIKKQCDLCKVWVDKSYKYCPFCSNPIGIKAVAEVVTSTPEVMQEEIRKTKDEAIHVVENNQTKYVERHGLLTKVKQDFSLFVKSVGDKVLKKKSVKVVKNVNDLQTISNVNKKDKKRKDKKRKNRR